MEKQNLAAGAFIFDREGNFYLFKNKKHDGKISLPMGKRDEGEDIKETCIREVFEEIGIGFDFIDIDPFIRKHKKHTCHTFLGITNKTLFGVATHPHEGELFVTKDPMVLLDGPYAEYNREMIGYFLGKVLTLLKA